MEQLTAPTALNRTTHIDISIATQQLQLWRGSQHLLTAPVSTAANGVGERYGSGATPRGRHRIRARIGDGCPLNMVFRGRRPTGEIYTPELAAQWPQRDWILSRILWLGGCESGLNRGGAVDTLRRYIYIHGTPECEPMGVARSHGCIRMHNGPLLQLFDAVAVGCEVVIRAE